MTKIIVTRGKNTVEASTTIAPSLELALPAEFNVQPDHIVPISKFLEAHIFANTPSPHHRIEPGKDPLLGYRIIIIDKRTGVRPRRFRYEDSFTTVPLDVQIFLKEAAAEAAPKTKRVVEREEEY